MTYRNDDSREGIPELHISVDENGVLLDGHHRVYALWMAGVRQVRIRGEIFDISDFITPPRAGGPPWE